MRKLLLSITASACAALALSPALAASGQQSLSGVEYTSAGGPTASTPLAVLITMQYWCGTTGASPATCQPESVLYDPVNTTLMVIKPASTPVAAGDPALAVSLSPLPAGTNAIGTANIALSSGSGLTATPIFALTENATAQTVKASSGTLGIVHCDNVNSVTEYVEFYTTSTPTLTNAPAWFVAIPSGGGGESIPVGIALPTGIYVEAVSTLKTTTAPTTALNCAIGVM